MEAVSQWVLDIEPFPETYRWVLRAAAVYLIGLSAVIVLAQDRASAFLSGHASTILLNTLEGVLRLIAGVALIGFTAQAGLPAILSLAGLFLAISAVAMVLLPSLHRRYAAWAVPFTLKILPVYAAGALSLGLALGWMTALPVSPGL